MSCASVDFTSSVKKFLCDMPCGYWSRHSADEVVAHADIVARRAGSLLWIEACPGTAERGSVAEWLCLVADEQRGLVPLVSAAIAAHSLIVLGAIAYCRSRADGPDEAVHLFAVQHPNPSIKALAGGRVRSIGSSIEAVLRGRMSRAYLERQGAPTPRPNGAPAGVAYFRDEQSDLLVVDSAQEPGLAGLVMRELFERGLNVVRFNLATLADIVHDEFEICERDGSRLDSARRLAVLCAVQRLIGADASKRPCT